MRKTWLVLIICLIFTLPTVKADFSAIVTTNTRLYAEPNINSKYLDIPKGTMITVKEQKNGAAMVDYKGKTCYIANPKFLSISSSKSTVVSSTRAKVYKTNSLSATSISVENGIKVNVLGTQGKWAMIEKNGNIAYIPKGDLALYAEPTPSPSPTPTVAPTATPTPKPTATPKPTEKPLSTVDAMIELAKSKLGCRYVYATSGPNTFDCSGFTKYLYKQVAGITLSSSAYGQGYGTKGTKITSVNDLKKGDIVCLNTLSDSDLSDHVGLYIGGGQFIHCSSTKGQVIISSITSGYYNRVFSWGMRIL